MKIEKKYIRYIIWWSLYIAVILFWIVSLKTYKYFFHKVDINTWTVNTWTIGIETGVDSNFISEHTKILITNQEWYPKNKTLDDFPKIKINNSIKNVKLIADITFTDKFINTYAYENSDWYFFALRFFLWGFDNWWYYSVYRKQNGWVSNSFWHNLVWAKLAYEIRDWATWYIDLNNKVPVAVDPQERTPTYQYKFLNIEKYLNENIWKEIPIGVYLSSVSELYWRELTKIKELKIIYSGKEWDLKVIQ
jgi:hypothetical protein